VTAIHLVEVRQQRIRLEAEAMGLLRKVASHDPTGDVGVIREFADVARLRELGQQLGWPKEEWVELDRLYAIRADQVRTIIAKEC
jgi:hypothetical protein